MTRIYRTMLRIIVPIEIEAESDGEAHRIIDGVLNNCTYVAVIEEDDSNTEIDRLAGEAERLERDEIKPFTYSGEPILS